MFGGLWTHEHNQRVLPKTECGCPSGGGIKNSHIRYPFCGGTQKKKKKKKLAFLGKRVLVGRGVVAGGAIRGRIPVDRIGFPPPPLLPSRIRPLNTQGAVGVIRRVAQLTRELAVWRRVADPAVRILPLKTEGEREFAV